MVVLCAFNERTVRVRLSLEISVPPQKPILPCEFLLNFCLIWVTEEIDVAVETNRHRRSPDPTHGAARLPATPSSGVRANAEKGEQLRMCRMSG